MVAESSSIFEILIVDDNSDNFKLLSGLLAEAGYIVRSAKNGELAIRSIKAQKPALVILNMRIPLMDGCHVCHILKTHIETKDIPVIFISSLDDEQAKIDGFNAGCVDFISMPFHKEEVLARVKTHLNLYFLQNELKTKNERLEQEITQRIHIKEALHESEEHFRATLYSIGDGVITTDTEGRIKLMNQLAEQITGWSQKEAKRKTLEEVFPILNEYTRETIEIPLRKVLREGAIVGLANHTLLIAKDGTERPIADSCAPVTNHNGEITGVVLVFRDQTKKREKERMLKESEQRFRNIFEHSPIGKSITSIDGQINVNQAFCNMLGYTESELKNKHWTEISHEDDEQLTKDLLAGLLAGKCENIQFEKRYIHKNGNVVWVDVSTFLQRDDNGNPQYFITSINNITERKQLKKEQFHLLNIIENSLDEIYVFDAETLHFTHVNSGALQNIGYTLDEIRTMTPVDIKPEHTTDSFKKVIEPLLSGKEKKLVFETFHRRKNGTDYPVEVHLQLDNQTDKSVFFAISNDITQRRQTEKQLHETLQKLQFHIENTPLAEIEFNRDYQITKWSANAEKLFGWKKKEVLGKRIEDIKWVYEEDVPRVAEISAQMFSGQKSSNLHVNRNYTNTGTILTCEWYNSSLYDNDGELMSVLSLVHDITKHVQSEELIKRNERKFRALIENNSDAISLIDATGQIIYNSPSCQNLLGFSGKKREAKNIFDLIYPQDRESILKLFSGLVMNPRIINIPPIRVRQTNDNWIWIEGIANNLLADPDIGAIVVNFRDTTERKAAENSLLQSEEKFRRLAESAPIAICIYQDDHWIYTNPAGEKLSGYSFDEFCHMKIWEFVMPEYQDMIRKNAVDRLAGEGTLEGYEFKITTKSGNERWVYLKGSLISYNGKPAGLISLLDLTQRKEMEKLLRDSEELYRSIFEMSLAMMILIDPETGQIVDANDAAVQFYGWPYKKLIKMQMSQINTLSPDELKIEMYRAMKSKHNYFVFKHQLSNGQIRDVEVYSSRVTIQEKALLFSIVHDITEKKLIEDHLRASERQYRILFEQASDGIFIVDFQGNYLDANSFGCEMLGYSREELSKLNIKDIIGEEEIARNPIHFKEMRENPVVTAERKLKRKDGSLIAVEISGKMLDDGRVQGIVRDITERKQAETELRDSEKKFRTLVESSVDGISLLDLNGNIIFANKRKAELIGVSSENDLIGLNIYSLIAPQYHERFTSLSKEFMEVGYLRNIETEIVKHDGTTFWAELNFSLVTDDNNNPSYIIDSTRNISERKKSIDIIENERKLLRTLIDNLPDSIFIKDTQCRKIAANIADIERMGLTCEADCIGKNDLELFEGEPGRQGYKDDFTVIHTGVPIINREQYFDDNRGDIRWLVVSKFPLFDQDGQIYGLVGIGHDITKQKKTNETIQKLTKSIEQSPSTIVITDVNGIIEYVNPKFSEITGYTKEEAIGQNPRILKSGMMPEETYIHLWETITAGEVWRGEFLNRKKNGALYWEWATMTSIKNEKGEISNYIAIKEDINLRKQLEADLISAKEKAEESDRLKSAFLANMSHEIRTPLNSIIGFSELLADSDFEIEQKKEFISHIVLNGNNLLTVISDIIDISKIESGEITIRKSKIQVKTLLDELKLMYSFRANQKKLQFNLNCNCPLDIYNSIFILADKERVLQVFNNLLGNALKFTEKGTIEIGCTLIENRVEFYVKDTGIGISPEFHKTIFERFRQVEASYSRKFGGNGLGLAISRNLISLMGGEIWVESELGKGTTFYFTLPKQ